MSSVTSDHGVVHLGLDVHKNTITVGKLEPDAETPEVDTISADEDAVRRLVARFADPRRVRACYEAGPTGYELARLLRTLGMGCEVIAPSLIPTAPGIGSRPTSATPAGWCGCSGLGSWSRSGCPAWPRRRCGTCVGPGPTW